MKVLIVVERTSTGFSAFSPDIAGCMATGATREEVERSITEAVEYHLEALRAEGQAVPAPHSYATFVEVAA